MEKTFNIDEVFGMINNGVGAAKEVATTLNNHFGTDENSRRNLMQNNGNMYGYPQQMSYGYGYGYGYNQPSSYGYAGFGNTVPMPQQQGFGYPIPQMNTPMFGSMPTPTTDAWSSGYCDPGYGGGTL